eukprot:TRINITY_DN35971_c0_g1_i2.p1 TRINITY_DN35971_c0_g1~~TRINITY_DN35971_c0_g1_i2.p1  ORF type:complete len:508 (-),score=86.43 TRINITY_DN35971_c0_g1_i2:74-1597(-)
MTSSLRPMGLQAPQHLGFAFPASGSSAHPQELHRSAAARPISLAELERGCFHTLPPRVEAQTLHTHHQEHREPCSVASSLHRWSTLPAEGHRSVGLQAPQGLQGSQLLCERLREVQAETETMRQDAARLVSKLKEEAALPPPASLRHEPLLRQLPREASSQQPARADDVRGDGCLRAAQQMPEPPSSEYMRAFLQQEQLELQRQPCRQPPAQQPQRPAPPGTEGRSLVAPKRQLCLDQAQLPKMSTLGPAADALATAAPLSRIATSEDASDAWRPGIMETWQPQHCTDAHPPPEEHVPGERQCKIVAADLTSYPGNAADGRTSSKDFGGFRRGCLRVSLGALDFDSSSGLGTPALFESSGFRIMLQFGGRAPVRWMEGQPATQQRELKYSRVVSSDGRYSATISCEFHEELDMRLPAESAPEMLCVDIWFERRTVVEQFDSILDYVGLGNKLPEYSRTFLGRVTASIPPEGVESLPQLYPVKVDKDCEGPRPKAMSIGLQWADCSSA